MGNRLRWKDVKACRASGDIHLANSLRFRCRLDTASVMPASRASCEIAARLIRDGDIACGVKKLYINMEEATEATLERRLERGAKFRRHVRVEINAYEKVLRDQ